MTLARTDLKALLEQFSGSGLMVSCYVDLTARPWSAAEWTVPFKTQLTVIKKMLADDATAWSEVEQDLQAIGVLLQRPETLHSRGLAIFAAVQRGFLQSFPVDEPVGNELVVHPAPYLVPLLQSLNRQ